MPRSSSTEAETALRPNVRRRRSLIRLALAFVAGCVFSGVVVGLFAAAGGVDVAQTTGAGAFEQMIATWVRDRSIHTRLGSQPNPLQPTAETLQSGRKHYAENCVMCHGAPGVEAAELSKGLTPPPPPLDTRMVQSSSDAELFWVIKNGIRYTAMPGFGPTHSDDEVWKLVLFVQNLSHLSPEDRAALEPAH